MKSKRTMSVKFSSLPAKVRADFWNRVAGVVRCYPEKTKLEGVRIILVTGDCVLQVDMVPQVTRVRFRSAG